MYELSTWLHGADGDPFQVGLIRAAWRVEAHVHCSSLAPFFWCSRLGTEHLRYANKAETFLYQQANSCW